MIAKIHKPGKAKPDPFHGRYEIQGRDGSPSRPTIVEYETDSDLRDTEQVPLLEEGGIEAFIQREVLLKPVLYLSHFFKRHRAEYYERLQAVRDHGQWEEWLEFFLRGVADVSREATETARRILALREDHRTAVTTRLGRAAGNGLRVLESLYQRPVVAVADVQALTGTTYTAANNLVTSLVSLGILVEATGYKRNRVFRYQPYIDLFGENPANPQGNP